MSPSSADYLATLSQVNNILRLLAAFGLADQAALLRPMLQKPAAGGGRPAGDADTSRIPDTFVSSSPPGDALTYLDTVLSNIRRTFPDEIIAEMARHDSTKARLLSVFSGTNCPGVAKRIAGCQQAFMVLQALSPQDAAQAHLIPYVCNQRPCPACSRRRSHELFARVMDEVGPRILSQPDEYSLRWLTLTMVSPPWGSLAPALDDLLRAWRALRETNHLFWQEAVDGYLFNVEITCNRKTRTWHPHIHVVYSGRFMPQTKLNSRWRRRLASSDRHGNAHIGACYVLDLKRKRRTPAPDAWTAEDLVGCLREVTKYTLKPFESLDVPAVAILELHHALLNRRLVGAGGILATSPTTGPTRWRNLKGLGRMVDDRESLYWTSTKFSAQLLDAALRDDRRWLRLVQNYSHFWHLQNGFSQDPDQAKVSPELPPLEQDSS